MKSQPQDRTIKTNCKNCAFAIYEDSVQIACLFNRVEKFKPDVIEAYDDDKQFFVINRLCTYYRDKAWGYSQNDAAKVEQESALSFDLVFDCNELDDNKTKNISNFLSSCKYDSTKLSIFLIHESDKHSIVKDNVAHIARNSPCQTNISVYFNIDEYMHQLVMNSKHSYHSLINPKNTLNSNMLDTINNMVNQDLKRFIVADSSTNLLVNNFIYKTGFYQHSTTYSKLTQEIVDQSKNSGMYIEV